MCFTEIVKINYKNIKRVIVHEIVVAVDVIKSKLIIVILRKKRKGFRARVSVQNLLNALKIDRCSAAMLTI